MDNECKSLVDIYQILKDVQSKVTPLIEERSPLEQSAPEPTAPLPPPPDDSDPYEGLEATDSDIVLSELKRRLDQDEATQRSIIKWLTDTWKTTNDFKTRLDGYEERLKQLEQNKATSTGFGFELNVMTDVHVLKPYGQILWGVGGELLFMPAISPTWRFILGGGAGYGGKDNNSQPLKLFWGVVGAQPQVIYDFYLPFGLITEQRLEDSHLNASSYGVFVEPKYCPGRKQHRLCLGLRSAFEATVFQGPLTGETFARPDGSFSLKVGYDFWP